MQRLALAVALGAVIAAAMPSPGQYVALGLAILAIGTGWLGYADAARPGAARLAAAAAITIGGIALLLGAARVVLVLAAIDRMRAMVG